MLNVFSECSPPLYSAGMATLPLGDKDPLVSGFTKWKRRPGRVTFEKWRGKFPAANVGYVPGLSGGGGIVVIDDDGGARERIVELFGDTPGKVGTQRGHHFLYRAPKGLARFNLKALGINADVKLNNDIVVGPGSIHESGHVYGWSGCDERVLRELPLLDLRRLGEFQGDVAGQGTQAERKATAGFREGSRKLQLNDCLCRHAGSVVDAFELIDIAQTWNEGLIDLGICKMEESEVVAVAKAVWRDHEKGKLECWHGRRATVKIEMADLDKLSAFGKEGTTLAMPLLVKLRGEHGGRMERGESFALNQRAMVKAQTMPGWTRYDYEKARNILLKAGLLTKISDYRMTRDGRQGAQFKLR